jgi:hypothetical protein
MLTEFGLADEDGEIDKSEFIILCMVRTGAASPELIKLIEQYFNALDDDNSGTLSVDEILKNREGAEAAAEKLLDQVSHHNEKESEVLHTAVVQQKRRQSQQRRASLVVNAVKSTLEQVVESSESPVVAENPMVAGTKGRDDNLDSKL